MHSQPDFEDSHSAAERLDPVVTMQWAVAVAVGALWVGALTWLGLRALDWIATRLLP